jgi:hypothetical protein
VRQIIEGGRGESSSATPFAECALPYLIADPPSTGKSETWPTLIQRGCERPLRAASSDRTGLQPLPLRWPLPLSCPFDRPFLADASGCSGDTASQKGFNKKTFGAERLRKRLMGANATLVPSVHNKFPKGATTRYLRTRQ